MYNRNDPPEGWLISFPRNGGYTQERKNCVMMRVIDQKKGVYVGYIGPFLFDFDYNGFY